MLLGFLLVLGCSKNESSSSATSGESPVPATPLAKLDCANILSPDLRARYFAETSISDKPQSVDFVGECLLAAADGRRSGIITVSCPRGRPIDNAESIRVLKQTTPNATDLALGRGGVLAVDEAGTFVAVWDDDSACDVTMRLPLDVDAAAFTKDLLASLPPATRRAGP